MRELLRFIPAQQGAVQFVSNGKGSHNTIADKSEWSKLAVRAEDLSNCMSALKWACVDSFDFFFNAPSNPKARTVVEVEIPGKFVPPPSVSDTKRLVASWHALHGYYPNFRDLIKPGLDEKLTQAVLLYLLDKDQGKAAVMPHWAVEALRIKRQEK